MALIELAPSLLEISQLTLRRKELTSKKTAEILEIPEFARIHKLKRMMELGYFDRYAY